MIIVKLKGGLGNQLFQYATALYLAEKFKQDLKFDLSWYEKGGSARRKVSKRKIDLYNLKISRLDTLSTNERPFFARMLANTYFNKIIRILKIIKIRVGNYIYYIQDKSKNKIDLEIEMSKHHFKNYYLDGYWQELDLLESEYSTLLKEFELSELDDVVKGKIEEEEKNNSVSIHIRRTDLVVMNKSIQENDYYKKAIDIIREKVDNPQFYIFSDDIKWCMDNFYTVMLRGSTVDKDSLHFCTNKDAIGDFACMKACKHNIVAKSTFSWWAAYLNNNKCKIVVSPEFDFNKDLIPNNWIVIR